MAKIKVRARAVDMLGRQQIAGIPTAIHELFKNAHDAYANRVDVDYFRDDDLLVLRDDGLGMTKHDFENRWLTLGTESKVGANTATQWTGLNGLARRPIMGEKGIGRLAIAAIAPQALILTRAVRKDGLKALVASFVQWRLFEIPGVDLESIEIPVIEFENDEIPDQEDIAQLIDAVKSNIKKLDLSRQQRKLLLDDLEKYSFNPAELMAELGEPTLLKEGHGTHFYLCPVYQILADDIDNSSDDTASPLEKMLLGFSNTMLPETASPTIIAEFRDHRNDGSIEEIIGPNAFFTVEEFLKADHHIDGEFDEYGQFSGTVGVYGGKPVTYQTQWPKASGKLSECGPFKIKFAYVQGRVAESRLPAEEWALISAKLNKVGGLYVYRDGIRVLPYGNSDFDFLNIERRRTKSAQDWFFSYRRMFGAIEIGHEDNSNLVEKAGREGFRANRAYREFVDILENFFTRLAIDFFRPTAVLGDEFNSTKEQLIKDAALLAKRELSTRIRRKSFANSLDRFFAAVETGEPSKLARELLNNVKDSVKFVEKPLKVGTAENLFIEAETSARSSVESLKARYTVQRPRGVGQTANQQKDWISYQLNFKKIQESVFKPLESEIETILLNSSKKIPGAINRRKRVIANLTSKRNSINTSTAKLKRDVSQSSIGLQESVDQAVKGAIAGLTANLESTFIEIQRTDTSKISDTELIELQTKWDERVSNASSITQEFLEAVRDQLQNVAKALKDGETLDSTTAALESQVETLKDRVEEYVELAQVGMALGIVQHEFGSTVKGIRSSIRKLKPWADGTPELKALEQDLRSGFNHLDSYLGLFTPLSRRLNKGRVDISGEEIRKYLLEIFERRLERHHIKLLSTDQFDSTTVNTLPSTLLPAFVNIIDNALYWVQVGEKRKEPWIKLDAGNEGFLVSNSGPPIDPRFADRIFELGETSKPGGRGMGLFLSKEGLRNAGLDLMLHSDGSKTFTSFLISLERDL